MINNDYFTGLPDLGALKPARNRTMEDDLGRLERRALEPTLEGPNLLHLCCATLDLSVGEVTDLLAVGDSRFEDLWSGEASPTAVEIQRLFMLAILHVDGHDLPSLVREGLDWSSTMAGMADEIDRWEG